jgi:hypothetical protein
MNNFATSATEFTRRSLGEGGPLLLADSHAHLDDAAFDPGRDQMLQRARQAFFVPISSVPQSNSPPR